jgi:hypothetical protein
MWDERKEGKRIRSRLYTLALCAIHLAKKECGSESFGYRCAAISVAQDSGQPHLLSQTTMPLSSHRREFAVGSPI